MCVQARCVCMYECVCVCVCVIMCLYLSFYPLALITHSLTNMFPEVYDRTEDLLIRISECNSAHDLLECRMFSIDVICSCPSSDVSFVVEKCVEIINDSDPKFRGVVARKLCFLKRLKRDKM